MNISTSQNPTVGFQYCGIDSRSFTPADSILLPHLSFLDLHTRLPSFPHPFLFLYFFLLLRLTVHSRKNKDTLTYCKAAELKTSCMSAAVVLKTWKRIFFVECKAAKKKNIWYLEEKVCHSGQLILWYLVLDACRGNEAMLPKFPVFATLPVKSNVLSLPLLFKTNNVLTLLKNSQLTLPLLFKYKINNINLQLEVYLSKIKILHYKFNPNWNRR